ncbi:hypothetical protein M011DRAFT_252201 [Sporormia fimetaria CBS 119925]|uniref:Ubiquitin 3 binding protein But2 C-terminal domain-containing protein n=1 Tax=Sporormia fimetaria CBS 119925 TaxID=1340428 RepID=A0A6A6UXM9_9PLEO|nr:hypothetical protein M011DRAFT_252201 [Sporormia fimetaria CBS 119925]
MLNPETPNGVQYTARLTPTYSTLFNFDVHPEHAGKTCSLVFYLPNSPHGRWRHYDYKASGGIRVSQLENIATAASTWANVGGVRPVGTVAQLGFGGNLVTEFPCPAGRTVGYRVDSINGLDLGYFQMVRPASGLFVRVVD